MRILYALFIFYIFASVLFSEKVVSLSEVEKPTDILCSGQNIFIMDGANVKVFDRKKGDFKFQFARKGEGPGEIKMSPFQTNTLTLHNSHIAIDSLDKVIYYSPEGIFRKEVKKGRFLAIQVKPVGENYVVKRVDRSDKNTEYITLDIYNKEMKKLKEIARQRSNIQFSSVQMIPDSIHFAVKDGKVYVERSDKGAVVDVFDSGGNPVKTIRFNSDKTSVTEKDKISALNRYKNDSLVKQIGFENLKKRIKFNFPDYFPEIANIFSFMNNLIIKTYKKNKDKTLYLMIGRDGKVLKKIFLPVTWEGEMISHLNGVEPQLYTFHEGYFYYIIENYDEEDFELHRITL